MRKEAKEFRAKKIPHVDYHKSQSMKLPEVPVPQANTLNTFQLRQGIYNPPQYPQTSNPPMNVNQFEQNLAKDQNLQILYNQFVMAYTEGKIVPPPQNGKNKTKNSKTILVESSKDNTLEKQNDDQLQNNSSDNHNSIDEDAKDNNSNENIEVNNDNKLLEQGVPNQSTPPRYTMSKSRINQDNKNPNFNGHKNTDHRPSSSARNSRHSSEHKSKDESRQGSAMKGGNRSFAKGDKFNKHKQNQNQYNQMKHSQSTLNNKEAEVLLINEKRPHKINQSKSKFRSKFEL
jgi:hypothetical protein